MQLARPTKKRSETRKLIRKNYFFEQLRPKLKEIFDLVDRSGSSTISILETKEALQMLNIDHPTQKIENLEDIISTLKDSINRGEITFDDFYNICYHLFDYRNIQQNLKDCPALDMHDPSLFIFAFDNKILSRNFSNLILDETVIMRKRIENNYAVNAQENIEILKKIEQECSVTYSNSPYLKQFKKYSFSLRDCWQWVKKSVELRKSPTDLTQGLLKLISAVDSNTSSTSNEKYLLTQYIVYTGNDRQEALNLLGWTHIPEFLPKTTPQKLNDLIQSIEKDQDYSRAAAISVFHFDFARAFQSLSLYPSSNNEASFIKSIMNLLKDWQQTHTQDKELMNILVCDTLKKNDDSDEKQVKPQDYSQEIFQMRGKPSKFESAMKDFKFIQTLCANLNPSDPYLKAICKFISGSENLFVIAQDNHLSLFDRLAFAFRFFRGKLLRRFLDEQMEENKTQGLLGGLLLTGKTDETMEIIQSYIDITSDIQTIALLGVYLKLFKFPDTVLMKDMLDQYKELMNRLGYIEERIYLEKKIYDLEKSFAESIKERKATENLQDQSSYAASQRCYYCNNSLSHPILLSTLGETKKSFAQMHKYEKTRINFCPDCLKPLPNCAICLLPVSIVNPYIELQEKLKKVTHKKESVTIDLEEALVWCQMCKHGGHFEHIEDWFKIHTRCPVSGCMCECMQNDYY